MDRQLERELLDELPASDPRAITSRRDLQRVNAWMGNARIMAHALGSAFQSQPPRRLIELGAGDGTFLLRVAQRLAPDWPGTTVVLLDRQDIVSPKTRHDFGNLGWRAEILVADVFDWLGDGGTQKCDAMIANLFLHHFSESQLSILLSQGAQQTPVFMAIEPRRWVWSLLGCRLLWLIRCNGVTRHDAIASVRAGFAGNELSRLWPARQGWSLQERPANLSSHLFIARRMSGSSLSS
jgi:hypothetical protein